MERASRRTRSQAAPDWTTQEALTLANEIKAVEAECGSTMSSFQKWQLTVEHCNALDVCRSMDQCKRKWDSLLEDYRRIKPWEDQYWTASFGDDRRKELGLPEGFDFELYEAIDTYAKGQGKDASGADTDPDTDPEAQADDSFIFLESGSKKQRQRSNTRKRSAEKSLYSWRYTINGGVKQEQPSLHSEQDVRLDEKLETPEIQHSALETKGKPSCFDDKVEPLESKPVENVEAEQSTATDEDEIEKMALDLQENAELINAVLEGKFPEDCDDDLKNVVGDDVALVRLQADKLINYLGKLSDTLAQLCDKVQQRK